MKVEKILALLVYCDAAITIVSMAVNRAMSWFIQQESTAPRGAGDFVLTSLWVAVTAATILAWVGLLNLWRPARAIYFWTWVAALLLLPLESARVFSPAGYMLDTAASLVGGALLGVLYFSNARTYFERAACAASGTSEARA
jgi:hypothetical protein